MSARDVTVLVVEDNDVDREAIRRAFAKHGLAARLVFVADGVAALELLRGQTGAAPLARPYLLLVDVNMPRMNGLELLRALRDDPTLHDSVVFVLTTSARDEDRFASYALNAAGFIVKSRAGASFERLTELVRSFSDVVELP